MANLSKASNVVQERYILYDVTGFTQKWHSIPVATNCTRTTISSSVFDLCLRKVHWHYWVEQGVDLARSGTRAS